MPEKDKCKERGKKKSDCGCGCLGTSGIGAGKVEAAPEKTKK